MGLAARSEFRTPHPVRQPAMQTMKRKFAGAGTTCCLAIAVAPSAFLTQGKWTARAKSSVAAKDFAAAPSSASRVTTSQPISSSIGRRNIQRSQAGSSSTKRTTRDILTRLNLQPPQVEKPSMSASVPNFACGAMTSSAATLRPHAVAEAALTKSTNSPSAGLFGEGVFIAVLRSFDDGWTGRVPIPWPSNRLRRSRASSSDRRAQPDHPPR